MRNIKQEYKKYVKNKYIYWTCMIIFPSLFAAFMALIYYALTFHRGEGLMDDFFYTVAPILGFVGAIPLTHDFLISKGVKQEALEEEKATEKKHRDEKREMWEYINASEYKSFVDETPDSLRGALAYLLWLRDLQLQETDRSEGE